MAALFYLTSTDMVEEYSIINCGDNRQVSTITTVMTRQKSKKPTLVKPSVPHNLRIPPKSGSTNVGWCEGSGHAVPDPRYVERKLAILMECHLLYLGPSS